MENFNPRTRMGCDFGYTSDKRKFFTFQSTHPHGVRPPSPCDIKLNSGFQSTHPHGVRPMETVTTAYNNKISIHAPAWGATKAVVVGSH